MQSVESLLLSLEAKRNELQQMITNNDLLKNEINSNTEYVKSQIDKLQKEIILLESRKLTIKKTSEELNGAAEEQQFHTFDYEYSDIRNKKEIGGGVWKTKNTVSLVGKLQWPMIALLLLFLLSIFLHTGAQLQITEYGTEYPVTYAEAISMGHPYEENHGISETLDAARLLDSLSWAAPIGYIATAFLMILNVKFYVLVGIIAACIEIIVFLSWTSIFDSMVSVIRYFYMDQNMALVFLPKMKICVACAVAICALCVYLMVHTKDGAFERDKSLLQKIPVAGLGTGASCNSIMVGNYNRLSELRMAYVNCYGSEGIDGISLTYMDYNEKPLTELNADIFFCDGVQTVYAIRNCRFSRITSNGKDSFTTEKLRIRNDVLPREHLEEAEVFAKQYSRGGVVKKEIQSYVKNTMTKEQQFLLKRNGGADAVVRPEILSDSWQCVCGNINPENQGNCCLCSRGKGAVARL